MNSDILELRNLASGFKICCQAEGKSPKTIEWYDAFLCRFRFFLDSNQLPTIINQINKTHIRQFIIYLQIEARVPRSNKPLSPATIQGYVRNVKVFFSWAKREGYIDSNIMSGIPVPKAPRKVINIPTSEQISTLLKSIPAKIYGDFRDYAIIITLYGTGLRIQELLDLKLDDVNLNTGQIRVFGKGAKERFVYMSATVFRVVFKYLSHWRPKVTTDYLFVHADGRPLTRFYVAHRMKSYGKKAGMPEIRWSAHIWRHAFAINYLRNGGDTFTLQRILGHSTLEMTRQYAQVADSDVEVKQKAFSPVERLKLG